MSAGFVAEMVKLGPGRVRPQKARTEAARIRTGFRRALKAVREHIRDELERAFR